MNFKSNNTKKLDTECRMPSLQLLSGRMPCLITFYVFRLVETCSNPACYLTFANLPSQTSDLATWKYLPTELKCSCEISTSVSGILTPVEKQHLHCAALNITMRYPERRSYSLDSIKLTFPCEVDSICTDNKKGI